MLKFSSRLETLLSFKTQLLFQASLVHDWKYCHLKNNFYSGLQGPVTGGQHQFGSPER